MNNMTLKTNKIPHIDFIPAKVKETTGENWRIVFYVKKPGSDEMKRFRRRVKKLKNHKQRLAYAKNICKDLNQKLEKGWSPFTDGSSKNQYQLLETILDKYMEQCERKLKDHLLRPDTYRSYLSQSNNLKKYLKKTGQEEMFTINFNQKFLVDFLDYIYFEKKRSARTSNNYLSFCSMLGEFMKDREFITVNPGLMVKRRKNGKKKREIIPLSIRNKVFKFLYYRDKRYLTLCLTVFFCFVRRTEITKLQVKHVNISDNTLFIPGKISKNGKDGIVTIPKKLKELLISHIEGSCEGDFLFSDNNFQPGEKKLKPKKISDTWSKMRKEIGFKDEYQFYSLKDTGITQLFHLNVPVIKIRDQARHHDIKVTEAYTPRNYECDETIRNLDFDFIQY